MKIAVILFNLGGPDSLNNVKPFLFNLFKDKAIIALPNPFRLMLAYFISSTRTKFAKEIYAQMGGKSTILAETELQAQALEEKLNSITKIVNNKDNKKNKGENKGGNHGIYKVFINMRYWHPIASETIEKVKKYNPDKIVLLPLYPQYSTTTTFSSIKQWCKSVATAGLNKPTSFTCCYPNDANFITAYCDLIINEYKKAEVIKNPVILFSAHGIPLNRIKKGDPYEHHVNISVKAIIDKLAIEDLKYVICYQSKVGPLKWLAPSTHDEIIKYAKAGENIIVVPISFVSEHSETLVELDITYKKLAEDNGAIGYFRVPTVRDHYAFIEGLAKLCITNQDNSDKKSNKLCPESMKKCFRKDCSKDFTCYS